METEIQKDLNYSTKSAETIELHQWLGNWIWRSVQCLVESPDFNPSPKWAAQRLGVSIENIVEAYEGLMKLGMIRQENNTYKVNSDWIQFTPQQISRESLLASHSFMAPQILSKLTTNDKFTFQFLRGNEELIAKFAPKFMQLFREMNEEANAKGLTEVIASEISFKVLTNKGAQGGGVQ